MMGADMQLHPNMRKALKCSSSSIMTVTICQGRYSAPTWQRMLLKDARTPRLLHLVKFIAEMLGSQPLKF